MEGSDERKQRETDPQVHCGCPTRVRPEVGSGECQGRQADVPAALGGGTGPVQGTRGDADLGEAIRLLGSATEILGRVNEKLETLIKLELKQMKE